MFVSLELVIVLGAVLALALAAALLLGWRLRQQATRTEHTIKESQDRYAALFESAPYPIFLIDHETEMIVIANPAAVEFYGYTAEELAHLRMADIEVPQIEGSAETIVNSSDEIDRFLEFKHRKKDGSLADVAFTAQLIEIQGHEYFLCHVFDISERKQMEIELNRTKEIAEAANQAKSMFLANMSHELRTPLNSIINFTRILMAGLSGPVTELQLDHMGRIRFSGEHLLGLINDILDLSKIEAGRMELHKERLQLADLVKGVLSTAVGLTRDKPIKLIQDIPPNLPLVAADRTRIREVLLNLLSNAAKFTTQGAITTRVRCEGANILVSISDTGIGIAENDLETIFEEFRQVDSGHSRRYEGTGLGLAICRRLVEMHGGEISVKSVVGEGSTFTFSLPVEAEIASSVETDAPHVVDGAGINIVVIDDDSASIEIVRTYLRQDGYTVHGITDSSQAIPQLKRIQPAAIILDVMMPHKDGWEVLSEIKKDPVLQAIPVVLYTIVEEQEIGFYLGAHAYLLKPIDEFQLRTTVDHLVAGNATVMVIDDDENARVMLVHQLQQTRSYNVVTANNGREAMEKIAVVRPDLIILDLLMPEVDGFSLIERLESDPSTQSIPVIVLTAKELTSQEHVFLTQRVNSLFSKGRIPPEHLVNKVTALLHMTKQQSSLIQAEAGAAEALDSEDAGALASGQP